MFLKDNSGLIALLVLTIFAISRSAFKGSQFTCARYISNTYMYIVLGILLIMLVNKFMDKKRMAFFNGAWSIVLLISMFAALFGILSTDPKEIVPRHLLWLFFILAIGVMMVPIIKDKENNNQLGNALVTTMIIVVGVSVWAYMNPEKQITSGWRSYLLTGLIVLIVLQFLNIFNNGEWRWISYFAVFLFCALLLHDTERLQLIAKDCSLSKKGVNPDYLRDSLNIFLDIINLFSNIR